jgi:hypothetical protein
VLLPILASVLILFGSPYVGEIRGSLRASFPEQYPWIVGGVTATAVVLAIGWAVARLRQLHQSRHEFSADVSSRRPLWVRYTLVIAAVAVSAGYARAVSSGDPEVDLVEAFHFVEYGLVAFLFYRPWRGRADVSGVALARARASRWESRMNGSSGSCPGAWERCTTSCSTPSPSGAASDQHGGSPALVAGAASEPGVALDLGAAAGGLLLAFAGFVDRVHLGYEIEDGRLECFAPGTMRRLSRGRGESPGRWKVSPPRFVVFRHEDHYLSEGEWHIQRRNIAIGTGLGDRRA